MDARLQMLVFLFFLFLFTPLIEIAVFIEIGDRIGLWPTLGVVLLTAALGTALFRIQGLATLRQAQANMGTGVFPAREVFDGLCLLVAGTLLITPGFVTDTLGFLLFLPPFRRLLRTLAERHLALRAWPGAGGTPTDSETIEGVYWEVEETAKMPKDEESKDNTPPPKGEDGGKA